MDATALSISPFAPVHAQQICRWPTDADDARAWAGAKTPFPVEPAVFDRWHADADVRPFVGSIDERCIAYGELWEEVQECELARIIVAPETRNRGFGRRFTTELCRIAFERGYKRLFLRVVPTNLQAQNCYRSAGFGRVDSADEIAFNAGQPVSYVWMQRDDRSCDAEES